MVWSSFRRHEADGAVLQKQRAPDGAVAKAPADIVHGDLGGLGPAARGFVVKERELHGGLSTPTRSEQDTVSERMGACQV